MSKLTLTSFNIRCFGFNGDYFAPAKSELRVPFLKKFVFDHFSNTDVFILQEIMDPSLLPNLLPQGFKFYTYEHTYPRHMYIALCCRQGLDFVETQIIPDTAIDSTSSRPAFYGVLTQGKTPLAQIVGVHLKSDYNNTDNRIKQALAICEFLNQKQDPLPVVLAGDFNSHLNSKTKKNRDDLFYLNDLFEKQGLKRAELFDFTYITSFERAHLDHIWTSAQILETRTYNYTSYAPAAEALKKYFDEISDHLPVSATLAL
ncbi:MAG: endonuclease/exonuclease/phosphatase family protein [Bdellovibrionaceae bacterium]|nr:endonuclease/exonuclease/phosphatase family protein [Pseudobdellovibrionaceae bacterium]